MPPSGGGACHRCRLPTAIRRLSIKEAYHFFSAWSVMPLMNVRKAAWSGVRPSFRAGLALEDLDSAFLSDGAERVFLVYNVDGDIGRRKVPAQLLCEEA